VVNSSAAAVIFLKKAGRNEELVVAEIDGERCKR
jgi:hypothetical protein